MKGLKEQAGYQKASRFLTVDLHTTLESATWRWGIMTGPLMSLYLIPREHWVRLAALAEVALVARLERRGPVPISRFLGQASCDPSSVNTGSP